LRQGFCGILLAVTRLQNFDYSSHVRSLGNAVRILEVIDTDSTTFFVLSVNEILDWLKFYFIFIYKCQKSWCELWSYFCNNKEDRKLLLIIIVF